MVKGLTFYACFGPYAGFGLSTKDLGIRLVLGWVSLAMVPYDVEATVGKFLDQLNNTDVKYN